jgi:hypothetical protein
MQFLCFLGFSVLWFVQWLCHLLPPEFYWLQGFMCVCAQVGCSVVCNWSLCDLFGDVCILIYLGFNLLSIIFNFYNFVCSWDTRRWIKSKSTIRLILTHHSQNPTKMTATCWTTGVQLPAGAMMGIFLFATASRPDLGAKRPWRESDHSTSI